MKRNRTQLIDDATISAISLTWTRPGSLFILNAILIHGQAIGACNRNRIRSGPEGLLSALKINTLAVKFLHPHTAAAGTAAKALLAAAFHLCRCTPIAAGLNYSTRLIIDVIIASKITGIMNNNSSGIAVSRVDLACGYQVVDKLTVMYYFEISPELLIIIFQGCISNADNR